MQFNNLSSPLLSNFYEISTLTCLSREISSDIKVIPLHIIRLKNMHILRRTFEAFENALKNMEPSSDLTKNLKNRISAWLSYKGRENEDQMMEMGAKMDIISEAFSQLPSNTWAKMPHIKLGFSCIIYKKLDESNVQTAVSSNELLGYQTYWKEVMKGQQVLLDL